MTDAPMLSGGHWDALLDALPTDPAAVTDEHIRLVLAALEGDERLLRAQRADILFIASVTECREPVLLGRVVEGCKREQATLGLGQARVKAWAWRVAYDRYPELHDRLCGLLE